MRPRIAIPRPHAADPEYADRALPQYVDAIKDAGGEPVVIPLNPPPDDLAKQLMSCDGVLLPGSKADLDPEKYGASRRHPKTAAADPLRDNVDELLLQDAYNMRKPILGICYGLQALNVWRTGTLIQDLAEQVHTNVPHTAGRSVAQAHTVAIDPASTLGKIVAKVASPGTEPSLVPGDETSEDRRDVEHRAEIVLRVNSSHHQAAEVVGDGLRVVARCPTDGVIEAIEGTAPNHFVLGVQWHPERTTDSEPASRAIFKALVEAAENRKRP